jgi:hypothetical protein
MQAEARGLLYIHEITVVRLACLAAGLQLATLRSNQFTARAAHEATQLLPRLHEEIIGLNLLPSLNLPEAAFHLQHARHKRRGITAC